MNYKVFPFGKYKGFEISEIPLSYIVYALTNMDLPEELEDELKFELSSQLSLNTLNKSDNDFLKATYKNMCKKYHPDKGGTNEAMAAINDFYNILIKG